MGAYETKTCVHRWILGEPTMQSVLGVCRRCGAQRTYPSGIEMPEADSSFSELDQPKAAKVAEFTPDREFAAA